MLSKWLHHGEEYVEQPPGFKNRNFPTHAYKLNKALYRLKQAPRAWYNMLSKIVSGFSMEKHDMTLY